MPCINCYISWAQQGLNYVLGPLILWLFYAGIPNHRDAPPTFGPKYLPAFVRGFMAVIAMGKDEDRFLIEANRTYGPIVYLPWPLKQYLVTDAKTITKVYETSSKTLAFTPIREHMQRTVFGGSTSFFYDSRTLQSLVFTTHGKGLAKNRLQEPMSAFLSTLETELSTLGEKVDQEGHFEIELLNWIKQTMFDSAIPALFGPQVCDPKYGLSTKEQFDRAFQEFDQVFPILASELLSEWVLRLIPPIRKGLTSRDALRRHLGRWASDGAPGLGESSMLRQVLNGIEPLGLDSYELGTTINGTFWALQANGPNAAAWLILCIVQSPIYDEVRKEIDEFIEKLDGATPTFNDLSSSETLPLLNSALYETLRLCSSAWSIRDVELPFFLSFDDEKSVDPSDRAKRPLISRTGCTIPGKTRLVAATRLMHINDTCWENASKWDGKRFLDREGEEPGSRSKRIKDVKAFGGGISVCEGRHFAHAELKSIVALTLSKFNFEIKGVISPTSSSQVIDYIDGSRGIAPSNTPGRPGMGIYQCEGDVQFVLKRRKLD